jgi:arginyl-tRNA synthetase
MAQPSTLYAAFADKIDAALVALEKEAVLPPGLPRGNVSVEPPRDPSHG